MGTRERERLELLERGTTTEEALAFYDSLPAVTVAGMLGTWSGAEIPTGHPLDGLLTAYGWHGKRFDSAEAAHPLLFEDGRGGTVSINPSLVPISLVVRHPRALRRLPLRQVFRLLRRVLATTTPRARLRMMEFRGEVSATMVYDSVPVHDAFRHVDDDTLIGAMDLRGLDVPFLFSLRREALPASVGG